MAWQHIPSQKKHTQDGCQLAHLIKPAKKETRAVDVGCGDGIIIFELLRLNRATKIIGIDISKEAISTARKNLAPYSSVELLRISASQFFKKRTYWDFFDLVVVNPPFFPSGSGLANKRNLDQLARHEGSLSLKVWANGARRLLRTGGELYCVFPTERLSECLSVLSKNKVEPKELWWLREDSRKRRFFLRAVRGGKPGLKIHFEVVLKGVSQGNHA